jgi:hypothetical protein
MTLFEGFPKICRENSIFIKIGEEQRVLFMKTNTISRSVLLRLRNVSDKICRENEKNTSYFSVTFFFENRAVYEITWKNIVERFRPQITIWLKRVAYWTPKATESGCVILNDFPMQ